MLNSLVTFFNKTSPIEALEIKKPKAEKHIIYRDELSKIKPATKSKPTIKKGDISNALKSSEPLINKEEGITRSVMRVKVMMTKKEANRLLSKCKDGGLLDFKDVAREIVQIPVNRVTVINPPHTSAGVGAPLKSIPEES